MSKRFIPRGVRRRLRKRFGTKVYRQYSQNARSASALWHPYREPVARTFLWEYTPQGHHYWRKLDRA